MGRAAVRLVPGETIPADCKVIDAFKNHNMADACFVTVEVEWIPKWDHSMWNIAYFDSFASLEKSYLLDPLDEMVNGRA